MTETTQSTNNTEFLNKRIVFFHIVELISVLSFTVIEKVSGLLWLAVAISFIGLASRMMSDRLSITSVKVITMSTLVLSSLLWGYIIMYYLASAPIIYTILLAARFISTIIGFKEIKDQFIVILPLLIGYALLQQAGCIPPLDF